MADPLNYRPANSAIYYTPTRQLHVVRMILGVLGGMGLMVYVGFLYAVILPQVRNPLERVGTTAVTAVIAGAISAMMVRFGRVRKADVGIIIRVFLGLTAICAMWLQWVHDVLKKYGAPISYVRMITHPTVFGKIIVTINRAGTWSYSGSTMNGIPLLILWLIEAGMILFACIVIKSRKPYPDNLVCQHCGKVCKRVPNLPRFSSDEREDFLSAVESREFGALASHAAPRNANAPELALSSMTCPGCANMNILTVNRMAWDRGPNGRPIVKIEPLINQLLLTPEEAMSLRAVCAKVVENRVAL